MSNEVYTEKQLQLMRLWKKSKLKRINLLEGSVRSGKTWISLVLWAFWVGTTNRNGNYIMTARTLTSLKRNCLDLLEELVGTANFTYSLSAKQGQLFGRKIYLEGANDARAESKIRGMTLQGAYCDELTLFTEDFFGMLLSRLSEKGAKLIGTTNPDNPSHWLKANYIDKEDELDMLVMRFLIDDNTFLDKDYVKQLKKEYAGVFYRRFILGEWCNAEGVVYPMFEPSQNVIDEIPEETAASEYYISIDYGTLNPCSMGLWRIDPDKVIKIKEYYHDGRKTMHQKTDEEYYTDLEILAGDFNIQAVVVDPSAASFITTIRHRGKFNVRKAKNDVLDGIRHTGTLIAKRIIQIHSSCTNTIREFNSYSWDSKSGKDAVIKEHDHAMDEMRYLAYTVVSRGRMTEDLNRLYLRQKG